MATSSRFSSAAKRNGMRAKGMARYNTCSCHPKQWGAKKATRRARRRVDKAVILQELAT